MTYIKIPDKDYKKAVGQFRLSLNGVLENFKMYGMEVYIPGAIDEIIKLAEDFSLRVRGVDKPISIDYVRRKK